jgi:hypothetical protein
MNKLIKSLVSFVTVASLVVGLMPSALAGEIRGPRVASSSVRAHSTDRYDFFFEKGEQATVLLRGDGDTDLDCYLRDEDGDIVASDTDSTDMCILKVTPRATGRYRLEIKNLGNVYNEYVVRTN